MEMKRGYLHLEDGERFMGWQPDWQTASTSGEVVFSTGMTGYPESLTDPSFAGQILTFTYPLIGNYGVCGKGPFESNRIQVRGVIMSSAIDRWSHVGSTLSLLEWFKREGVISLVGVDTRRLVKHLRSQKTLLGYISDQSHLDIKSVALFDPAASDIVSTVTSQEVVRLGQGKKRIVAIDCGIKESQKRELLSSGCEVMIVPAHYDISAIEFDGLFLTSGPGDPTKCSETIASIAKALKRGKPTFGICLGCQLLALAIGAKTIKLPFGHRGQNVPCIDLATDRCFITSQNHGFAIDETSLPADWKVAFRNLNDNTVEGIRHEKNPFFAVQFHPEATPGPVETRFLFERFFSQLHSNNPKSWEFDKEAP